MTQKLVRLIVHGVAALSLCGGLLLMIWGIVMGNIVGRGLAAVGAVPFTLGLIWLLGWLLGQAIIALLRRTIPWYEGLPIGRR